MLIDRRMVPHFDYILLFLMMMVPCLGLVVLYSAGFDPDGRVVQFSWLPVTIESYPFLKQLGFLAAGLGVGLVILAIPPSFYHKYAYLFYGVCLAMLVAVDLTGYIAKGSQRWLTFGGLSLQPAEPTKLAVILALARYLARNFPRPGGYSFRELIIPSLIFLMPAGLIMGQPDLGTALIVVAVGFSMMLFSGVRWKVLLAIFLIGIGCAIPAWNMLHDYQKRRVLVLLDPDTDPKGSGYHIIQSKIAVGSGSLTGKGYMKGTQAQLEFLPEHTTDFIFSVLAEEWGFVGCLLVLIVYLFFLLRLFYLVHRSKDLFSGLAIFGIAVYFFVQATINVGMVIGLLPVVGLPLPLFSYGGSSMLSCMIAVAIVLGMDMRRLIHLGR